MNNEIKEILYKLKDNDWYDELDLTGDKWIKLKQTETKQILDYITNLQQENKRLKEQVNQYENPEDMTLFYMWLDVKAKDKIKDLQQENHELKSKLECYENGVYYSSKVDELEQENKRLKEEKQRLLYNLEKVCEEDATTNN